VADVRVCGVHAEQAQELARERGAFWLDREYTKDQE
jgi:hypothetical protein